MLLRLDDSRLSKQDAKEAIEIYVELRRKGLSCTENDILGVKLNRRYLAIRSQRIAGLQQRQDTMAPTNQQGSSGLINTGENQNNSTQNAPANIPAVQPEQGQATHLCASRIARIPAFFAKDPRFWFEQLENIFQLHQVTVADTKFNYVMSYATDELQPFLAAACKAQVPAGSSRYDIFREHVIRSFAVSDEARLRKLFSGQSMGNQTPSQFLATLRAQAPAACDDTILKTLFREQLPENIRTVLAVMDQNTSLERMAAVADKIMESTSPQNIASITANAQLAPIAAPQPTTSLESRMDAIANRLDDFIFWFRTSQMQKPTQRREDRHRPRSRSRSPSMTRRPPTGRCFYHDKYGKDAQRCKQPCNWKPGN